MLQEICAHAATHKSEQQKRITYRFRRVLRTYSRSIEQETDRGRLFSLALAEGIHELLQLRGALDLEKNFVMVVRDLDIQVLHGRWGPFSLSCSSGIGHFSRRN